MARLGPLNVANQLTLLRLVMVPAFALLVIYGEFGWALIVFVVAGITDGLDGLIARLTNQRTAFGAWLDPMADKMLLVTTFIVLSLPGIGLTNRLPVWLTVLVISRDVVIVATVAIVNLAIGTRTFMPSIWGKSATAAYMVTASVVLLFNYLGRTSVLVDLGEWISLALAVISAAHYFFQVRRIINEPPPLS